MENLGCEGKILDKREIQFVQGGVNHNFVAYSEIEIYSNHWNYIIINKNFNKITIFLNGIQQNVKYATISENILENITENSFPKKIDYPLTNESSFPNGRISIAQDFIGSLDELKIYRTVIKI